MACPRTARSPFPIAPARFSRSRGRASDEAKPARGRGETPPGIFPRNVGFQGFASRALFPTSPTGDRRRFQFCIERFQGLRRLFLQLSNFVILAVRQPEPRTVSCPPVYQILWVRGFRAHTIPGRGFNLFKPLRRHFRATPFCRQALSRRDPGDRRLGVTQHCYISPSSPRPSKFTNINVISPLVLRTPPEQAARPADPSGSRRTAYTHGNINSVFPKEKSPLSIA